MAIAATAEELGYEVCGIAGSFDEAVNIARREKPSLVVADINLGKNRKSGVKVVEQISAEAQARAVFVTSYAALAPEGARVLRKPFTADLKRTLKENLPQLAA